MGNDHLSVQISRPPKFDLTSIQPSFSSAAKPPAANKGKGKAKAFEKATAVPVEDNGAWACSERLLVPKHLDRPDDRLWVDRYEPTTEVSLPLTRQAVSSTPSSPKLLPRNDTHTDCLKDELAVNKRKVQDVRQWLLEALTGGPSGKLKKYRVRPPRPHPALTASFSLAPRTHAAHPSPHRPRGHRQDRDAARARALARHRARRMAERRGRAGRGRRAWGVGVGRGV